MFEVYECQRRDGQSCDDISLRGEAWALYRRYVKGPHDILYRRRGGICDSFSSFINFDHGSEAPAAHYNLGRQLPYASGSFSLLTFTTTRDIWMLSHS